MKSRLAFAIWPRSWLNPRPSPAALSPNPMSSAVTHSRLISAGQAELVRRQVEAGQHFRRQVEVFWEACEQWANAQLDTPAAASEAAKKKGSKLSWKRKWSKRS